MLWEKFGINFLNKNMFYPLLLILGQTFWEQNFMFMIREAIPKRP